MAKCEWFPAQPVADPSTTDANIAGTCMGNQHSDHPATPSSHSSCNFAKKPTSNIALRCIPSSQQSATCRRNYETHGSMTVPYGITSVSIFGYCKVAWCQQFLIALIWACWAQPALSHCDMSCSRKQPEIWARTSRISRQ